MIREGFDVPAFEGADDMGSGGVSANIVMRNVMIAALVSAAMAGCGGRVEGSDEQYNLNADAGGTEEAEVKIDAGQADAQMDSPLEADSETGSESMTRGEFIIGIKEGVIRYPDNGGKCEPLFNDVQPDTKLCRAANFLAARGLLNSYKDGFFKPDIYIKHDEAWKLESMALTLPSYEAPCVKQYSDIDKQSWYYNFTGAVCDKGFTIGNGNKAKPGEPLTYAEFDQFSKEAKEYFDQLGTRGDLAEVTGYNVYAEQAFTSPIKCTGPYADVPNDTTTCEYVNLVTKWKAMSGYKDMNGVEKGLFGPNDIVTYDQMAETFVTAAGITPKYSGCSGVPGTYWAVQDIDALCDLGLWSKNWNPQYKTVRYDMYRTAWDLVYGINNTD
jgi:hypothetical protein